MAAPTTDRQAVLADLQRRIRALESGERPPGEPRSIGERRRVASLEVTMRLRADAERAARRRRAEFEAALDAIVDRTRLGTAAVGAAAHPAGSTSPITPWGDGRDLHAALDEILQRVTARAGTRTDSAPVRPAPEPADTHWSPVAIVAYRIWAIRRGLHGVFRRWDTPAYQAGCLGLQGATERHDPDIPHTDGRCGHPPCGIYAAKNARDLDVPALRARGRSRIAVGLVALTGKVVEHERGYRAGTCEVRALAVIDGDALIRIGDGDTIAAMFRDPERTLDWIAATRPNAIETIDPNPRAALSAAARYLEWRATVM